MAATATNIRVQFFDYLFGDSDGYLCIATGNPDVPKGHNDYFRQKFFKWPVERAEIGSFVSEATHRRNVWFCTSLLERAERKKELCLPSRLLWADLDTCSPEDVKPRPQCVIESSPRRFQAIWRVDHVLEPYIQEDFNRRIAYKYIENGSDPTGWDLTQLLRVPLTYNYKYEIHGEDVPQVKLIRAAETLAPVDLFAKIPKPARVDPTTADFEESMPDILSLPATDNIIYKYWPSLARTAFKELFTIIPEDDSDWSILLWRFINVCIEAGMSDNEAFACSLEAKCNKYARDNRPAVHLWQDVVRASENQKRISIITSNIRAVRMPVLVEEEVPTSFIDTYKSWAAEATDAIAVYHELSAAILLSSVCAGGLRLKVDWGELVPNLWGLILGDSTLTRKTTAMRMAMDMVYEFDKELILATDGSAEGLLTGLSARPHRTSIYYKDEVSGFIDSYKRKDYLAGLPETLTHLYDVPKIFTRRLRKETITVASPVFIFFGGGIRDKVHTLLTEEDVLSGFLPRFIVVGGETDLSKIRRTSASSTGSDSKRDAIQQHVTDLYEIYGEMIGMKVGGLPMGEIPVINNAFLTEDAWECYGDIETKMVEEAYKSSISMLALPTFERLSRSLLKLAMLLAASERQPIDRKLEVTKINVLQAAKHIQEWGQHSVDLLLNVGHSQSERRLQIVLATIKRNPHITKSDLMRRHHMTSREANDMVQTLEDRGLIATTKEGRGIRIRAI